MARIAASPGLISGLGGDAGFGTDFLARNDDGSDIVDASSIFEDGINFFGTLYNSFYVNNNGSITFAGPRSAFTPTVITEVSSNPEITPFFGDVDTRNSFEIGDPSPGGNSEGTNLVYWAFDELNDRIVITWDDVGFYNSNNSLLNAFQLILTDQGNGDFDIEFRYEDINWTTGNASGGENGLGGDVARAGWTAGTGDPDEYFELPQSGDQQGILDLDNTIGNTGLVGIWQFFVRSGEFVESQVPPAAPESGGWVVGDPHLLTLDGINYDFQAVGEYVLVRSTRENDDFEVQARFVPGSANNVSIAESTATTIDGHLIEIDAAASGSPLLIDGVAVEVDDFTFVDVGNGRVYREGSRYTIVYPGSDDEVGSKDTQVTVTVLSNRLDIRLAIATEQLGDLEGLLGDGDGSRGNDVALADGTELSRPFDFDILYGQFRDDWRVKTVDQSLFTYGPGEGPDTHYDPDYPALAITLADLTAEQLAAAQAAALNAGLSPDTPNFENAVLDFALTGDLTFITSSANVPVSFGEGTEGDDFLTGDEFDNRIFGLGGDDTIRARAGDDTLRGGSGNDSITGREGNDDIWGDGGDDTLRGGDDNDSIRGSQGEDLIQGGEGDDFLRGQQNADEIYGGNGDDNAKGGGGNDTVDGGDGDDFLTGGSRKDVVDGGNGDDKIAGNSFNDTLSGGDGNDTIKGGGGDDIIDGGAGDDFLKGGDDADRFIFDVGHASDYIVDFDVTEDELHLSAALVGSLTEQQIEDAATTSNGSLFLDFGNGDMIQLAGITSSAGLTEAITIA